MATLRRVRRRMRPRPIFGLGVALLLGLTLTGPASAATFDVNTTDNADDGVCDANHCSLREAILAANANPGPDLRIHGGAMLVAIGSADQVDRLRTHIGA